MYRGNGDGTFVAEQSYPAGVEGFSGVAGETSPMVAADLNLDQIPDIVMRAPAPPAPYVMPDTAATIIARLGNGDGTFGPEIGLVAGIGPVSIAVADVDEDGKPDLIVITDQGTSVVTDQGTRLSVYHGNGDGTFSDRQDLVVDAAPRSTVSVADWNSDGIPDLVVADDYLHVLLGTGQGKFAPTMDCGLGLMDSIENGIKPPPIIADFDRDGMVDLVSGNTVMFGMHDCNATRRVAYHASYDSALPLTAADLNGDGVPDIAFAFWDGIGYLPSDGHGSFGSPVILGNLDDPQNLLDPGMANAFAADVNGDGRLDLIVANQISIRAFINTCM